jgi:coenzyme F420 hydrogenase subunit beta
VVHTGMDPSNPWMNQTVASRTRSELLAGAGSRYAPSSPCEGLRWVEASEGSSVFIGKPCDAAAVSMIRRKRPRLDAGLGLVLSFFCAGTPSTGGTLDLLGQLEIPPGTVQQLRYRGDGWPGCFRVRYGQQPMEKSVSYQESWDFLQRRRPFRCHLCPDGMGELADISCGDAWHTYSGGEDDGSSLVLVRSERGREILRKAMAAGYLVMKRSKPGDVIAAQRGLIQRRQHLFGRLLAMRMMMIPVPRFPGFHLFEAWASLPPVTKVRTVAGTVKRIMARRLWCINPLYVDNSSESVKNMLHCR